MAGIASLSSGSLPKIMSGEDINQPVLQILGTKKINSGDQERLRLLISDGHYFNSFAMLATQLNTLYADGKLTEYTVVRVDKYITSVVNKTENGKRVLIILDLTVLHSGTDVAHKIGNPVPYTDAKQQNSTVAQDTASSAASSSKSETKTKPQINSLYNQNNNKNNNSAKSSNNSTLNQSLNPNLTHPISSLSPYQNKWVIKARVSAKNPIRTWSNAKGEGKLFSMDLMDESGEIRATAFKEQCDKFYDMIEVGRIYYISKCQLKPANKQYTTLKNDYEMTFTNETVVQLCEDDDDADIPDIKFDLVPISTIAKIEPKTAVDTIGICKDVGELQIFNSRTTNKEFKKRDLVLVDNSNAAVNLTLWGDDAVNFDGHVQPIVLVKGARVTEFNGGKSLSIGNGSMMKINPDIPEGHKLRGWFDNGGAEHISNSISATTGGGGGVGGGAEWLTFHEARVRNLGSGDKPDYFQCKAIIHIVKNQNAFYKACPQAECNKKVVDEGNGQYRCERCNAVFPDFKYRLLINMSIGDWTSNRWVTCFSDLAEQLLGRTAKEVGEALENNPSDGEEMLSELNFKTFVFKLRCKMEIYGDMQRNKLTVMSALPVDYKEYNKYLINNLKDLTGIGKI